MIHVYETILGFFDYDSTIIHRDFFETDASFPRVNFVINNARTVANILVIICSGSMHSKRVFEWRLFEGDFLYNDGHGTKKSIFFQNNPKKIGNFLSD